MALELGCKFTVYYFSMGLLGSLIAVWTLPGCYTELPRIRRVHQTWRIEWAVVARLLTGGIAGCVADKCGVNALFAGFFAWHLFKWLNEEGWKQLRVRLGTWLKGFKGGTQ